MSSIIQIQSKKIDPSIVFDRVRGLYPSLDLLGRGVVLVENGIQLVLLHIRAQLRGLALTVVVVQCETELVVCEFRKSGIAGSQRFHILDCSLEDLLHQRPLGQNIRGIHLVGSPLHVCKIHDLLTHEDVVYGGEREVYVVLLDIVWDLICSQVQCLGCRVLQSLLLFHLHEFVDIFALLHI